MIELADDVMANLEKYSDILASINPIYATRHRNLLSMIRDGPYETVDLTPDNAIEIGAEIANCLMCKEWNTPQNVDRADYRVVVLSDETINAIVAEVVARMI